MQHDGFLFDGEARLGEHPAQSARATGLPDEIRHGTDAPEQAERKPVPERDDRVLAVVERDDQPAARREHARELRHAGAEAVRRLEVVEGRDRYADVELPVAEREPAHVRDDGFELRIASPGSRDDRGRDVDPDDPIPRCERRVEPDADRLVEEVGLEDASAVERREPSREQRSVDAVAVGAPESAAGGEAALDDGAPVVPGGVVRSGAPSIASENISVVPEARHRPRVAVVGGGIAGAFAAYFLARLGARPTLIERGEIGGQASGRTPGNLAPCYGAGIPGPLHELALASFRLHLDHADDLGIALHPAQRLQVALDDADVASLEAFRVPYDETPGFSARWLDPAEALVLEPRLTHSLVGGLLLEGSLRVDGGAYTKAAAKAAVALGAETLRAEALGLEKRGDRATGVVLDSGLLPCDAVVVATGPWCEWLDVPLPVEPVKGELLVVEVPGGAPPVDLARGKASACRAEDGRTLLGDTEDRVGFDDAPTASARSRILAGASAFLPAVAEARVVGHTAGLRPVTPDGLPIVGRLEPWENVCVANGAGRKGILLSTGLGLAVAELLVRDETELPIGPCSPARFVGAQAA